MPALEKAKEEISDPEARTVCGKAFEQLQSIEERLKDHKSTQGGRETSSRRRSKKRRPRREDGLRRHHHRLPRELQGGRRGRLGGRAQDVRRGRGEGEGGVQDAREDVLHDVEDDDEDDDAEQLCDCKFTLAYGSKVLLHNTKPQAETRTQVRSARRERLGEDHADARDRQRAGGRLPACLELRTVFVEADIIGELSDLPCVDYILADERIKKAGISRRWWSACSSPSVSGRCRTAPVTSSPSSPAAGA